jgi:hypothetical protein
MLTLFLPGFDQFEGSPKVRTGSVSFVDWKEDSDELHHNDSRSQPHRWYEPSVNMLEG